MERQGDSDSQYWPCRGKSGKVCQYYAPGPCCRPLWGGGGNGVEESEVSSGQGYKRAYSG
ncbi:hypothetical protein ES708_27993 [subsurface metagenome]